MIPPSNDCVICVIVIVRDSRAREESPLFGLLRIRVRKSSISCLKKETEIIVVTVSSTEMNQGQTSSDFHARKILQLIAASSAGIAFGFASEKAKGTCLLAIRASLTYVYYANYCIDQFLSSIIAGTVFT